nr:V4R domain-containing protein [uncultured Methanobacterium sp.]
MSKKSDNVHIYIAPDGPKIIESPIKAEILSMLEKEELYFDEILTRINKSKPTLSSHLKVLEDKGIIGSKSDPVDKRKKLFFIKAKQLVEFSTNLEVDINMTDYIKSYMLNVNDQSDFNSLLFRTIRIFLLNSGMDINPLLYNMGVLIGESFYEQYQEVSLLNIEDMVITIGKMWEQFSGGRFELVNKDPLTINIDGNLECDKMPNLKRPMCAISSGIFEAVFSNYFQSEVSVNEVKCHANGDGYCSFEITPVEIKVKPPITGTIEFI